MSTETTTTTEPGTIERDGVRISYAVHGSGDRTIVCCPGWMIVDSTVWLHQPGAFDGCRVVTYDARGSGLSDRPTDAEAYSVLEHLADLAAVLDATGTERATLLGNSFGAILSFVLAATQPDRVEGMVLIGSSVDLTADADAPIHDALAHFNEEPDSSRPWPLFNRRVWHDDFAGFVRWFIGTAVPETDARELRELAIDVAMGNTPEVLAATVASRAMVSAAEGTAMLTPLLPAVTCPTMLVHGELDAVSPLRWAEALSAELGAPLHRLADAGHCPQATRPDEVNALIRGFLATTDRRTTTR